MKNISNNPQEQAENFKEKYPHAFSAQYLQEWARSRREIPEFSAFLKGSGDARGEITMVRHNGRLMIKWGGNNYALLPDGGERDPIYIDGTTAQFLGLDLNMAINAKEERKSEGVPLELQIVKAHRAYEEAMKEGKDAKKIERLRYEWKRLRAKRFPHEEVDFLREESARQAKQNLPPAPPPERKSDVNATEGFHEEQGNERESA